MTKVVEGLRCPHCDHDPFGSKAALGSHVSAKHGLTLTGAPAPQRKRRTRRSQTYLAQIDLDGKVISLALTKDQLRDLLVTQPEATADALLAA